MKIIFRLRFYTHPGQSLWLTGNHALLGDGRPEKAVPLHYLNSEFWQAILEFPDHAASNAEITYHYILRNPDGSSVHDWGRDKAIHPASFRAPEVLIIDSWNDAGFVENAFYTEPFTEVLLHANRTEVKINPPAARTHTFKIKSPLLVKGQTLCVLGGAAALADWNIAQPVLMNRAEGRDYFTVQLDLSREKFPVEYKYGIYDVEKKIFVRYEEGANRILNDAPDNRHVVVNDGFARLPAALWKGAGVAVPVFSLRSEKSFGVGEFADLKPLADWCRRTGLKLIQILPVNDTSATHTWVDSYPYSSISAFALHPIYLNLDALAGDTNHQLPATLEPERNRLNALDALDYEAVMKAKLAFLKQVYRAEKNRTLKSRAYRDFFAANEHWLVPYAVFCHLRDQFGTSDFHQWPEHRDYDAEKIAALAADNSPAHDSIAFNYFLQYHLHRQLKDAVDYAHRLGIILKGDIPIGVARHGADAWQHRELFHLDMQAGAPPDAFTAKGQNWGFPTYHWGRMKADGFQWWKQRFEQMSRYFDAFRIDHILGFFRIWSIPVESTEGLMGFFEPAIPVREAEFAARGIAFERERFTTPFINDAVLSELFGSGQAPVKEQFLENHSGNWKLKAEFSTQRKIEAFFAAREKSERNEKLKSRLCDLVGNVILFPVRNSPGEFHFRFGIDQTSSFRNLDPRTRDRVWDLYVDYFFRRQDPFWKREAMEKLPALKCATNMLVCGEDLGLVPACVPEVMRQLGLLSLEIQRMPKDSRHEFFRPATAPYLSVVTPSTHDMSTVREWWEEDRAVTQRFFNRELHFPGEASAHCDAPICRAIIEQHLASPAMWSVFQLQDLLGMDEHLRRKNPAEERINVPANPKHYWRYRLHLSLETLLSQEKFNDTVQRLVRQFYR